MIKILAMFAFSLSLCAQDSYTYISSKQFPTISKLTNDYQVFVDEQNCQSMEWCDSPEDLDEFSQVCLFYSQTASEITILCYHTYQSEADQECMMKFDLAENLITHVSCDQQFFDLLN